MMLITHIHISLHYRTLVTDDVKDTMHEKVKEKVVGRTLGIVYSGVRLCVNRSFVTQKPQKVIP